MKYPEQHFLLEGIAQHCAFVRQRALAETLGEVLPQSIVFDYPTVEALADYLAAVLPELIGDAEQQNVDAYEDLTEADLSERVS